MTHLVPMLWGAGTGYQLRALRFTLGYSQEEFADLLGVAWITVQRWETEERFPRGLPNRILHLLDKAAAQQWFFQVQLDPRARDPLFVLYKLLERTYAPPNPDT